MSIKKRSTPTKELIKIYIEPLTSSFCRLIFPSKTIAFIIQLTKINNRIPINPKIEKKKNLLKKEIKILCFNF